MRLTLTTIIGIDQCFEFGGTQQTVRFRYRTLPMDPFRFNGVEPRTFAGQVAGDEARTLGTPLDLLMVLANPGPHRLTTVPGGVVPDQEQGREALCCKLYRAPCQKLDGDGTHRAPGDKAEPHLVRLLWPRPHQQAITGQRLGIGVVLGWGQLLQLLRGLGVSPALLVGLGEPTPPDFVANPQRPRRLGVGPLDEPVAPFFFRAYAGSGLVIQCLARFQVTPNRRRASRMVSSLTSRGVRPWATLTSAASASVHRLVGLSNVRGLWCHSARRDSQAPASKMVDRVCGRDEWGCSPARPRS